MWKLRYQCENYNIYVKSMISMWKLQHLCENNDHYVYTTISMGGPYKRTKIDAKIDISSSCFTVSRKSFSSETFVSEIVTTQLLPSNVVPPPLSLSLAKRPKLLTVWPNLPLCVNFAILAIFPLKCHSTPSLSLAKRPKLLTVWPNLPLWVNFTTLASFYPQMAFQPLSLAKGSNYWQCGQILLLWPNLVILATFPLKWRSILSL